MWLLFGHASASELARYEDDESVSWTGAYFGAHGAFFTGEGELYVPFVGAAPPDAIVDVTGFGGGLHAGGRYQFPSNIVVGLDYAITRGVSNSTPCTLRLASGTCEVELDWEQTVTARLGYAWGRFLVSGLLGLSIAETNMRLKNSQTPGIASAESDATRIAETYGAMVEYAMRPWLTFGLEWSRRDPTVKMHHVIDTNGVHVGAADLNIIGDVVRVRSSIQCCSASELEPAVQEYDGPFSWTGGYFGFHGAYFMGNGDLFIPANHGGSPDASADLTGANRGLHAGARYQFHRNIVAGLEYQVTRGVSNRAPCTLSMATGNCEVDQDWEQSVTARLGYARGRILVSGIVGASISETVVRLKQSQTPGITFANSTGATIGVTYGAMVEYAMRPWLTFGLEWDRSDYDIEAHNLFDPNGINVGTADLGITSDVLRVKSSLTF